MKEHIIDYVKRHEKLLVSPIWGGERTFHFLCMGHLDLSKALGFDLVQATPVLTTVREGQLRTEEELEALIERGYFDYATFDAEAKYLKQILEERNRSGEDYLCGGGCFGPLTVVSGILGAENLMKLVAKKPSFVERFVSYVTDFLVELATLEADAGQEFFWIAEPLASLFSPERCWRFSGQYLKRIFEAGRSPGFLHVCGNTTKHTKVLEQTGAEVLSIDYCTDIGRCIREVQPETVIMGNVNPGNLLLGTPDEVREEIRGILKACEGYPNLVLSTGCSIMGGTTDEQMAILFEKY